MSSVCSDVFSFRDLRGMSPVSLTYHLVAQLSFVLVTLWLCSILEGYLSWTLKGDHFFGCLFLCFVVLGAIHVHTTHSHKTCILHLRRNFSWELRSCKTFLFYSMNELLYSGVLKVKCTEEKNFFIKMQFILIKQITSIWWNVKLGAPHITKSPVGLFWQAEPECNIQGARHFYLLALSSTKLSFGKVLWKIIWYLCLDQQTVVTRIIRK